IVETSIQGVVIGLTASLTIFLIVTFLNSRDNQITYTVVKDHYKVEKAEFTPPADARLEGDRVTTVTFVTNNSKSTEINSAFVDIEFFDYNGKFIFGVERGSPYGEYLIPPKSKDNMSVTVPIPETVDFEKISYVSVDVYELERK